MPKPWTKLSPKGKPTVLLLLLCCLCPQNSVADESPCEKIISSGIERALTLTNYDQSGVKDKKSTAKALNGLLERLSTCVTDVQNLADRKEKLQKLRVKVSDIIQNEQNLALRLRGVDFFLDDIKSDILNLSRLGHRLPDETPETLNQSYQYISNDLKEVGSEEFQDATLKHMSDLIADKYRGLTTYIEQNDIVTKFNQTATAKSQKMEVETVKACQGIANSLTSLEELKPLITVSCMENFETAQFLYRTKRRRMVLVLRQFGTLTEGNNTGSTPYNVQLNSALPRVNFKFSSTPVKQCKIEQFEKALSGEHNGLALDLTIVKAYEQGPWEEGYSKLLECENGEAPPSPERVSLCSKYKELADTKLHDTEVACHDFLGTPEYYKALLSAKYCFVQLLLSRTKEFVFSTVKGPQYVDAKKAPFWFKKVKEHLEEIKKEATDLGVSPSSITSCGSITKDRKSFVLDSGSDSPPGKWADASYSDAYYYFSDLYPDDFGGPRGFLINGSIPAQWHPMNSSCNVVAALSEFRDYNGICSVDDQNKKTNGEENQGE